MQIKRLPATSRLNPCWRNTDELESLIEEVEESITRAVSRDEIRELKKELSFYKKELWVHCP